jgi:hypothetical protein
MMLAAMTAYSATEKKLEPQITTQMQIQSGWPRTKVAVPLTQGIWRQCRFSGMPLINKYSAVAMPLKMVCVCV